MNSSQIIRPKKGKGCGCRASKPSVPAENVSEQEEKATPAVDIIEGPDEFILVADLPGAVEEMIDVEVNDGELIIAAEAPEEKGEEAVEEIVCRCHRFEPGNFYRSFRIAESIDTDRIAADYRNGVLSVHLPKKAELEPKKICVGKKKCGETD